jgi:hypothetical protein
MPRHSNAPNDFTGIVMMIMMMTTTKTLKPVSGKDVSIFRFLDK